MRLFFAVLAFSVILPFESFSQNARTVRAVKKKNAELLKGGADIVIDPIEQVPVESKPVSATRLASAPTNWGVQLLLPESVKTRLRAECTRPVVLKVYDTAPRWGHSYLQTGQIPGANYTGEAGTDDLNGHSTHCAGIAAGDGFGIASVLVEKGLLKLKAVKILTDGGSGNFNMVEQAILGELTDDARLLSSGTGVVVSGSFGGGTSDLPNVEAALKKSTEAGVLYVFAAGNTGQTGVNYPGRSQYGIAVAALQESPLQRAGFSTMGPQVVTGMPGALIYSTYKNNTFATLSGTSMATPFSAGLTCIALSKWGRDYLNTPARLRAYLAWVCTDIQPSGKDDQTGYGISYVLSVLDKNPSLTPDLPGTPNPPDPPTDPVFPERKLSITFDGPYSIGWLLLGGGATENNRPPEVQTIVQPVWAAANTFNIEHITLQVTTKTDLPTTFGRVSEHVKRHFSGRGYMLPPPADAADAVYWAAYFLEMISATPRDGTAPVKMRVLRIEGKGPAGEKIEYTEPQLRHF